MQNNSFDTYVLRDQKNKPVQSIRQAANEYKKTHGKAPNTVVMSPSLLAKIGPRTELFGLKVEIGGDIFTNVVEIGIG